VRESFLRLARVVIEEMARGKRWTVMPLCRKTGGIYVVSREWKALGEGRGKATLLPCQGGLRPQEMSA